MQPLGEHLVFAAGHDYGSVVDVLLALPNSKALLEARAGQVSSGYACAACFRAVQRAPTLCFSVLCRLQERYTPLIAAVSAGAESIVKSLLVRGASTAAQTEVRRH